jgi:sulfotransferase family protein
VIDAHDVLMDPRAVLEELCRALGIPWDIAMLSWLPGRRRTDGPWAPHWYGAVEASTGFGPPEMAEVELPEDARRLADRCRPYYRHLARHRLRP